MYVKSTTRYSYTRMCKPTQQWPIRETPYYVLNVIAFHCLQPQ